MLQERRSQAKEYILNVVLLLMAIIVLINWHKYDGCEDPLNIWEFTNYSSFILFRIVQFTYPKYLNEGQTVCKIKVSSALFAFNVVLLYPFLWGWTILGCVYYARLEPSCFIDDSINGWGFLAWIAFLLLYLSFYVINLIRGLRQNPDPALHGIVMEHVFMHYEVPSSRTQRPDLGLTKIEINSIACRLLVDQDLELKGEMLCAICLDNLHLGDEVRDLLCQHLFHTKCLDEWLEHNNSCPTCRTAGSAIRKTQSNLASTIPEYAVLVHITSPEGLQGTR